MKRRCSYRFGLVLGITLILTLKVSKGETNTLIVPIEAENTSGNSAVGGFFESGVQQVYAANEFAHAPLDILTVTEIAFRVDETFQEMDAIVSRIVIRMNVFPGSMDEVVEGKSGIAAPVVTVYDAEHVRMLGRTGQVEAFDVRFRLQTPFVYDRRKGQLTLYITFGTYSGTASAIDSVYVSDQSRPSFQRGAQIYLQPITGPFLSAHLFVTRFTYLALFSRIDRFQTINGKLEIDFTVSGDPKEIRIESARSVSGPFTVLDNVELIDAGEGAFRATLALPPANQFFRVALR